MSKKAEELKAIVTLCRKATSMSSQALNIRYETGLETVAQQCTYMLTVPDYANDKVYSVTVVSTGRGSV